MIVQNNTWDELSLNEKINYRGTCVPALTPDLKDSPVLGQSFGRLTMTNQYYTEVSDVLFSEDIEFIADAIEENVEEQPKYFAREMSGDWWEDPEIESSDDFGEVYYSMVYLASSSLWMYTPNYLKALKIIEGREEKSLIIESLLRGVKRR